jgi:hypothetical protein
VTSPPYRGLCDCGRRYGVGAHEHTHAGAHRTGEHACRDVAGRRATASTSRLDPADIEAIAQRVAELIDERAAAGTARYVDAAKLAQILGVERKWIYAHAHLLGAIRLGGGHARLRFDVQQAARALGPSRERGASCRPRRRKAPPRRPQPGCRVDLLPYES